jgi:hypothetical protein
MEKPVETRMISTRKRLKTPRAAAIAGIIFALLYGASLILIRYSIPSDQTAGSDWMGNSKTINLALNIMPFAGIAFLWFIGVIRDRLGEYEDRLFSTVFLGSGLIFLTLNFVGAALASGLLSTYASGSTNLVGSDIYTYSRAVMYNILNIYALRMEGVFMISISTIWMRTGLMHRGWSFLSYALALGLLVSISISLWVAVIFPAWVLMVSIVFLIENLRDSSPEMKSIE